MAGSSGDTTQLRPPATKATTAPAAGAAPSQPAGRAATSAFGAPAVDGDDVAPVVDEAR